MRPVSSFLASLSLSAPALAGQVIVVGPAPGQQHDLQDTILVAQEGDVLLVKGGTYESIRAAGRSITIVAENGQFVQLSGGVRVIDFPAQQRFVLSGLNATAVTTSTIPELNYGLYLRNDAGQVIAQDCAFRSTTTPPLLDASGARLVDCAGVSIVRSSITDTALQRNGLVVTSNTKLDLQGVQVLAGNGSSPPPLAPNYDGGAGGIGFNYVATVASQPSFVFLGGCQFTGGSGGTGSYTGGLGGTMCGCGGRGGDGILGDNPFGQLVLLATTASGGAGGPSWSGSPPFPPCPPTPGPNGESIHTGPYNWCFGSAVSNAPATPYTSLSGTPRTLSGTKLVRDNQRATLSFQGAPGERVEFAVTNKQPGFQYQAANSGVLHVSDAPWHRLAIVPVSGTLTASFRMPDLPLSDPGATYFVQARFVNTAGQVRLSNLHVIVEVDATY